MGSRSRSSSTDARSNVDNRSVNDASGGGIIGSSNTINLVDGSTALSTAQTQAAADIFKATLTAGATQNADLSNRLFSLLGTTTAATFQSQATALALVGDVVRTKQEGESGNKLAMLAIAAAAVVAVASRR